MRQLSSPLSNGDESKTDAASNQLLNQETVIGVCCQMRKATSDARRFHSLPVPAVLGIPFAYCRDLKSQNFRKTFKAIRISYCSMPESTRILSNQRWNTATIPPLIGRLTWASWVDGLHLLGTLSQLGISFPNRIFFI